MFRLDRKMSNSHFKQSCLKFKQATEREYKKRRQAILIDARHAKNNVVVTSVETNLPKLNIQDLIATPKPRIDPLANLVQDLGIDKDEEDELRTNVIWKTLSSIQSIEPGRRTRFQVTIFHLTAEVHIRRSLDVWIILEEKKLIFPKPRNDRAHEASEP